jgi:hypothetical protein
MFLDMIDNIKFDWGNVDVFNEYYIQHKGNIKETINSNLFYPFRWQDWRKLLSPSEIPNVYSVHLYHTMFEKHGVIDDIEVILSENPGLMLSKISNMISSS